MAKIYIIIDCASSYTRLEKSDLYSILGLETLLLHLVRWCDDIEGHYVVSPSRILFDVLGFGGAVLCGILRIVKRVVRVQS